MKAKRVRRRATMFPMTFRRGLNCDQCLRLGRALERAVDSMGQALDTSLGYATAMDILVDAYLDGCDLLEEVEA